MIPLGKAEKRFAMNFAGPLCEPCRVRGGGDRHRFFAMVRIVVRISGWRTVFAFTAAAGRPISPENNENARRPIPAPGAIPLLLFFS